MCLPVARRKAQLPGAGFADEVVQFVMHREIAACADAEERKDFGGEEGVLRRATNVAA